MLILTPLRVVLFGACLQAITGLQQLNHLSLSGCQDLSPKAICSLVSALPALTRLDLNCLPLSDDHLLPIAEVCDLAHSTTADCCGDAVGNY